MEEKLNQVIEGINTLNVKTDMTNESLSSLTKAMERILKENDSLKLKIQQLEDKLDYLENQSRRNNIIIYGVKDEDNENWNATENKAVEFIKNNLKTELKAHEIERSHRLGKKFRGTNRPIIIKFNNFKTKNELLKASPKLKGTGFALSEDFSQKVKDTRNQLKPYLIKARANGHYSFLKYNKLNIDGKSWSLEELQSGKDAADNDNLQANLQDDTNFTTNSNSENKRIIAEKRNTALEVQQGASGIQTRSSKK